MLASDMKRAILAVLVPLAVAAVGCNASTPPPASPAPVAPKQPKPAHPQVVGTVVLTTTQKPAPLGGIVYFDDSPKQAGALTSADIIIHKKKFVPFISVLTAGGTASFANTDTVDHHVFSSNLKGWDTGMLKQGHPVSRAFASPGVYPLLCNIHPEMLGYLLVIPSTTYGRIGADGTYEIGNVPPGSYKLTAWVPRAPAVTKPVTVSANGTVTVDFEIQPSGETKP